MNESPTTPSGTGSDGAPAEDRRTDVLEPAGGEAGQAADNIRQEQGTHEAGMVPASFSGDGGSHPPDDRSPEDAADRADAWDAEG
ncbi:hypothetical protein [Arthrobacter sp. Br18]|uniref:hypothetical protein n=1 Tax=Arthrobacter sp. Br18 TaxID=1312954 RepID=UPI0004B06551|nr:hypothetical protein [Arthrobacter sp. Br18]